MLPKLFTVPEGGQQRLRDVRVPEKFYRRLSTGSPCLDQVFGGKNPGIVRGSVVFLTGDPGAGKSTFFLQIADGLSAANRCNVLYNAGEESRYMVKMAAERIAITGYFAIDQIEDVDLLYESCVVNKTEILMVDSLQSLSGDGRRGNAKLLYCAKRLINLSKDHGVTSFVIGHIVKGGRFAGPQEIVHDLDVHVHLRVEPGGSRVLEIGKNRNGPTHIPLEMTMTGNGIIYSSREPERAKTELTEDTNIFSNFWRMAFGGEAGR